MAYDYGVAGPAQPPILYWTAQILAAPLLAQPVDSSQQQALDWLQGCGLDGFDTWDTPDSLADTALALVLLVDFAEHEALRELAAVLLDKLLFTLALNSFQGTFGSSSRGSRSHPASNGWLQATSGICRLLWGMGCFNHHSAATVALAASVNYQVPSLIQAIALDQRASLWSKESQAGEIHKVTWRSPQAMLCSALDYRPGENGDEIHVWQATMGPDALVFVNHPRSEDPLDPVFWQGNGCLPRVAQWQDSLIAHYRLPRDSAVGFTHAYFPVYAFDEYTLAGSWAFARKGDAYLALFASQGLHLMRSGGSAYRELRSAGLGNSWICQLGRAALDGSFELFRARTLALEPRFEDELLSWTNLRGDRLEWAWSGPLRVNGRTETISGFAHYDSPFCVSEAGSASMAITYGDYAMRLDFSL
jgi:hypothetical protein